MCAKKVLGTKQASVRGSSEPDYLDFLEHLKKTFKNRSKGFQLFETHTKELFKVFLKNLPSEQQVYTCNTCKRFVERFAGLVIIQADGTLKSAMWASRTAPKFFRKAVSALESLVNSSKIKGVFYNKESDSWGLPNTGPWKHMHVVPNSEQIFKHALKNAGQYAAEKREDFKNMKTALREFNLDLVKQAVGLLKGNALYRSEKVLGMGEWLRDLHIKRADAKGSTDNILWREVALAPPGFCHPRASMIGTLLEDIASGMDFSLIETRFAKKMKGDSYQRPQVAPAKGNIEEAEKVIAKMGLERSLERRFARLEELECIWLPKPLEAVQKPTGGVFSHLEAKGSPRSVPVQGPIQEITWAKFKRDVLPEAERIEFHTPLGNTNYAAIVTAEHLDSPPILQWDTEEHRIPFSHYLYMGGSHASAWNLTANSYVEVTGVSLMPNMWKDGGRQHEMVGTFFILNGAKDIHRRSGIALFPETLKSELRSIRATIEAFSDNGVLGGVEESSACGYLFQNQKYPSPVIRVTADGVQSRYTLDRWE